MERSYKQIACTWIETLLSTMICAVGVCLFIEAGIGSDPIDVLIDGMHRYFAISIGQADQLYSFGFLLLALLCNRRYVGMPSIAYTVLIGFAIDWMHHYIAPFDLSNKSYLLRMVFICIGQICCSISYAIFQTVEKGMNSLDAFLYFLKDKTQLSYPVLRTIFDCTFCVIGLVLGGIVGVGTLFSACITGLMTYRFTQLILIFKRRFLGYGIVKEERS